MAGEYRVVCPDVVGRGRSDWLADKFQYGIPQYVSDMAMLLARLDAETVHWLGTSMGGLIGMALAATARTPITRLVLNDVGPVLPASSLARIGEYVGTAPRFASIEQAEQFVRQVSLPFGPLTDAQWRHLTVHTVRQAGDGRIEFVYDPGIGMPFARDAAASGGQDIEFWPLYDAITCPTLLLRGAASDLLTAATARAMTERGPRARLVEFAGIGHAPMLMDAGQIAVVREFLRPA
jgi:pimeloyl-ACP methyl ester carboxylesterase